MVENLRAPIQQAFHPEALPADVEALVSPEFRELSQEIIGDMFVWMKTAEREVIPSPLLQIDGYSVAAEAERDDFLRQISEVVGDDVDALMTVNEEDWRSKGGDTVVVQPWIKEMFDMKNPEEPLATSGVFREIVLAQDPHQSYNLHELEFANPAKNDKGQVVSRMSRIIYFTNFIEQ